MVIAQVSMATRNCFSWIHSANARCLVSTVLKEQRKKYILRTWCTQREVTETFLNLDHYRTFGYLNSPFFLEWERGNQGYFLIS